MSHKRVRCLGHEPIFIAPNYEQPWADVWIHFKTRPNRRHRYAPTLISKPSLERDLMIIRECQRDHPDLDYSDDIRRQERALSQLETQGIFIDSDNDLRRGTPDIYTARDFINRAEAERMLNSFMASLGFHDIKFTWRRPEYVVTPID